MESSSYNRVADAKPLAKPCNRGVNFSLRIVASDVTTWEIWLSEVNGRFGFSEPVC